MAEQLYMTRKEAARYLMKKGIRASERTLAYYAFKGSLGKGPRFFKLNKVCFYTREDLDNWLQRKMEVVG